MKSASMKLAGNVFAVLGMFALGLVLSGCGGDGQPPTFEVTGKVSYDGKPVTGGGLTFSPKADGEKKEAKGFPVSASIQSDGTFKVNIAEGKYGVIYSAPSQPASEAAEGEHVDASKQAKSEFAGLQPSTKEVTVSPSENTLTVELKK